MKTFGLDLLKQIKNAKLEGENAHCLFSPPARPRYSWDEILQKDPKYAAVNILLYLKDDEWYFPLMLRTYNKHDKHSGQISLPGGKREESDKNFAETAKRETMEEMGVDMYYNRIIREITPIYIPPSNFYVYPFISYTKRNTTFTLQETEAKELIEFPVASLLELHDEPEFIALPETNGVKVPVISFNGYIIWGATAMILSEFSLLLKNL